VASDVARHEIKAPEKMWPHGPHIAWFLQAVDVENRSGHGRAWPNSRKTLYSTARLTLCRSPTQTKRNDFCLEGKTKQNSQTRAFGSYTSPCLRILALLCGFAAAVLYRNHVGSFGISLGYFYVILVVTSGLWFGVLGGVTSALGAMTVHIVEITLYAHFQHQELASQDLFFRFSSYLAAGVAIGYYSQREKSLKKRLSQLAHFDELTGCPNHRFTVELLIGEIARARRYKKPLSLVVVDIDHFKEINDTVGHLYGNEVLKRFAGTFKTGLREIDVFGRYGGDEFLVILPDTDGPRAEAVIERIRNNLLKELSPFSRPKIRNGSVPTFSAGIGSMPDQGNNIDTLLKVADAALYQAKRLGRNRTFVEKRREKRFAPNEDLEVKCQPARGKDPSFSPRILNLTRNGMLISSKEKVLDNDLLCRFFLCGKQSVQLPCNVVHQNAGKDTAWRIGLSFPVGLPEAFFMPFFQRVC